MTRSGEKELLHMHFERDDSIQLPAPPELPELKGDDAGAQATRPSASQAAMSPIITAIRGQELNSPSIVINNGDQPRPTDPVIPLKRATSDAGTDITVKSRKTVSDRGESLYSKVYPPGGPPPPQVSRPLRPEHAPIVERLLTLRCRPRGVGGPEFYPRGSVEALMTKDVVVKEITDGRAQFYPPLSDDQIQKYAGLVCKFTLPGTQKESSFKKIFAILVILKRPWDIVRFVEAELCDADLPLIAVTTDPESGLFKMRHKKDTQNDLDCLGDWPVTDHENFDKHQWAMLAPWFAQGTEHAHFYELDQKDIMPWLYEVQAAEGGYGIVSKVKIHQSHHNFEKTPWSDGYFAIKQFKADWHGASSQINSQQPTSQLSLQTQNDAARRTALAKLKRDFEREIEILNRFSGKDRGHDHLISLLAAYQRGDECCLVFRWAHSDLRAMLHSHIEPGSALEKPKLQWLIEQCKGIADGLQRVHKYQTTEIRTNGYHSNMENGQIFGRHGDIKPENILLFKNQQDPNDPGRLVITDFGLTRFHNHNSKTYHRDPEAVAATPTYRPPECDMSDIVKISRSFDIWSLGCVFLEYITWYLGGWPLVDTFVQRRKAPNVLMYGYNTDQFFEIVREEGKTAGPTLARVKIEVIQFVDDLHSHQDCSDVIHEFLDFIMDRMLIVESDKLQERAFCEQVFQTLAKLHKEVANPSFQLVPNPRPRVTSTKIPEAVEIPLSTDARRITENRFSQLKQHTGSMRRLPLSSPLNLRDVTHGRC